MYMFNSRDARERYARRSAVKKSKFKHKTAMPKAWTKKKMKRIPTANNARHNKISRKEQPKFKTPMMHKQFKAKKRPSSPWKLPSILFISGLMMIMLVVPALVVVAFGKDTANDVTATGKESKAELADDEEEEASQQADDEPSVSVAVMRSETEQVEDVDLEKYVAGVVASEMPADFEEEALKAQALTARTFIVNHLIHQDNPDDSDVTDTVQHQVYNNEEDLRKQWGKDFNWKMDKITEAVAATDGEIITYDNDPITPAFFSTSNGYTENSEDYWDNELPYLRSVKSEWDEDSPKFLDQEVFPIGQVEEALNIDLPHSEAIPMEMNRTDSNRVSEFTIGDSSFSGREVREQLDLSSSDFTVEQKNDHLIFTTKGFGHGIGMSQYGANGMAKKGKSYQDIVEHYYKDIEVSSVSDTAPKLVSK